MSARTSGGYAYSEIEMHRIWLKYFDAAFAVHGDAELADVKAKEAVEVVFSTFDTLPVPEATVAVERPNALLAVLADVFNERENASYKNTEARMSVSEVKGLLDYIEALEKEGGGKP